MNTLVVDHWGEPCPEGGAQNVAYYSLCLLYLALPCNVCVVSQGLREGGGELDCVCVWRGGGGVTGLP